MSLYLGFISMKRTTSNENIAFRSYQWKTTKKCYEVGLIEEKERLLHIHLKLKPFQLFPGIQRNL